MRALCPGSSSSFAYWWRQAARCPGCVRCCAALRLRCHGVADAPWRLAVARVAHSPHVIQRSLSFSHIALRFFLMALRRSCRRIISSYIRLRPSSSAVSKSATSCLCVRLRTPFLTSMPVTFFLIALPVTSLPARAWLRQPLMLWHPFCPFISHSIAYPSVWKA